MHLAGHRDFLEMDWAARVIDDDLEIDIATFAISEQEVQLLGKIIMTGAQKICPPRPPPRKLRAVLLWLPWRRHAAALARWTSVRCGAGDGNRD
jgi:hypothetical protein